MGVVTVVVVLGRGNHAVNVTVSVRARLVVVLFLARVSQCWTAGA